MLTQVCRATLSQPDSACRLDMGMLVAWEQSRPRSLPSVTQPAGQEAARRGVPLGLLCAKLQGPTVPGVPASYNLLQDHTAKKKKKPRVEKGIRIRIAGGRSHLRQAGEARGLISRWGSCEGLGSVQPEGRHGWKIMRKGHRRGWESGSNWKPVTLNSLTFCHVDTETVLHGLMRLKLSEN